MNELTGAYTATFGIPAPLSGLAGIGANETAASASSGTEPASVPAASGGSPRGPGGRSRTTTVVTTALKMLPYESVLHVIGTASALHSVDVVSDTDGTVIEAALAANRGVTAGEVLVRFDARTETLNLEIAPAELEQAEDTVPR